MDSIYRATRLKNDELEYLKTYSFYKSINFDTITYDEINNMSINFTYFRILLKYHSDKLINKKFEKKFIGSYVEQSFLNIIINKICIDEFKQVIELYYKYGGKYGIMEYEYGCLYYDNNIRISLYFKVIYYKIFAQYWLKKIFRRRKIIYMIALIKSNIKLSYDIIEEFIIFIK